MNAQTQRYVLRPRRMSIASSTLRWVPPASPTVR